MDREIVNQFFRHPMIEAAWPGTTDHCWRLLANLEDFPTPLLLFMEDGRVKLWWQKGRRELVACVWADNLTLSGFSHGIDTRPPVQPGTGIIDTARAMLAWVWRRKPGKEPIW